MFGRKAAIIRDQAKTIDDLQLAFDELQDQFTKLLTTANANVIELNDLKTFPRLTNYHVDGRELVQTFEKNGKTFELRTMMTWATDINVLEN